MPPADDTHGRDGFAVQDSDLADLSNRYRAVRSKTQALAAPLSAEDQTVQAMVDASPTKWHLAHTTWFFETFVLAPWQEGYVPFHPSFSYLFNSYYNSVGSRHPRAERGLLTRPSVAEVEAYRRHVDAAMERWLGGAAPLEARDMVRLGLAHEEQHQELILMDILSLFAASPLKPPYVPRLPLREPPKRPCEMVEMVGGVVEIGADSGAFHFDNECPRHQTLLRPYQLASRLVTNGEWLAFMAAGGYGRPELWLSDGWAHVQTQGWDSPLYWECQDGEWLSFTLEGLGPLDPDAPVAHISFFEAAAFAAWSGRRLPTEAEWEFAAANASDRLEQCFGEVWQWTASAYSSHPGFHAAEGAVGEYNAKFMIGQIVLKGSASITPAGHSRPSYRNFFYPHQRWMAAGVRLACDAPALAGPDAFRSDVIAGLSAARRRIPAKWFYDAAGSHLFERICDLPEYYPTRQETALLAEIAAELAAYIPAGATLVELGSGASVKTRLLLDAAPQIATYAPVDISHSALKAAAAAISRDYPRLSVIPVEADFTKSWGDASLGRQQVAFFPGSTIGNFTPDESVALLRSVRDRLGPDGLFVVGVDLAKDEPTLVQAYNDAQGVTAAFNLNLLARINRDLGADIDLEAFAHRAVWNRMEGRMEMHLESLRAQTATIDGRRFEFVRGETIHTENSYKPSLEGFERLARQARWRVARSWVSPSPAVAVILLAAEGEP